MDIETMTKVLSQEQAMYLFYTIISAGFFFWISSKIQLYVKSLIALNKVTGSFRISKNNILRFGSLDGKILAIDRHRVEIEFEEFIRTIPTYKVAEMTWDIVKLKGK